MKVFIFALLACIAVSQAWLEHDLPARVPLVSNVPYPYGIVAPISAVRDVRGSASNVYSAGLGYNYGYNVYDRRFNDVALGYRGVVGFNAPLVGLGGIRGLNAPLVGLGGIRGLIAPLVGFGGIRGLNAPLVGFDGIHGLRK